MSSKRSRSSRKASKKAAKGPKLTCQCCQRSVGRDAIPFCMSKVEQQSCLQCDKEVCPKCLKRGQCYMCRLRSNENTNNEAALKKLKKDSLKAILKRLGMKSADLRNTTNEQMIRQIIKRCALDGNARASLPSTSSSFRDKDGSQATGPSQVVDPNAPSSNKEASKDQTPGHTQATGLFPLIGNIQNEDQIRQMTIPQLTTFLKYYSKFDPSMNEKGEFQEVAIQFWRTEMKIPIQDDANRKQSEQQQQHHQEQTVEIHGNNEVGHEGLEPNESMSATKKRESFTLPAEGQANIPMVGEVIQQVVQESGTVVVPPLDQISGEEEIQRWSTKQLKAFLEQYGRYNKTWLEKNTLQYEAIKTWKTELKKEQAGKEGRMSNVLQEPISEVQPKISITELPPLKDSDSEDSDDYDEDSSDDQRKKQKLTSFRPDYQNQEMVHEENLDARPKVVLFEIPIQGDQNQKKAFEDEHPVLGGKLSLQMEDFQDYDNIEAFMGLTNGGGPGGKEDLYVENHSAAEFAEMASESMETSDSFVYMQSPKDQDREKVHRPENLSLKIPTPKKVVFHPVTEQISDSDDDAYLQAREFVEDGASGGSLDALAVASNFDNVPMSPEEFFDTLREMEDNMADSSEFPDFKQAIRKRLSSDKCADYPAGTAPWNDQIDANNDGMHTPEEFLGTVYSIKADLGYQTLDDRDADISTAAQILAEEAAGKGLRDSEKFKEAETESGQSNNAVDSKTIDIPLIESSNEQVTKMLKTKAQRPESWGVSMDEIMGEENIKTLKEHHLKLLLQKHGIDAESLDRPEMVKKVTKLWRLDKQNRISIYEDTISEGDTSDESEGKISPDTEFTVCSLPPLPSPPTSDPQIIHVTMKEPVTKMEVQYYNIEKLSVKPSKVTLQHSDIKLESLPKKKPEIPKKPPAPPPPTRSTNLSRTPSTSAYLTFIMSEDEIEYLEEYKLRAILRSAKISMKDIWKREDLIEEVIKVWQQEQLDRGRSLERALSSSSFGVLNRSRKSSTESLQQEIDFDSIQTEKDLERLTSRNLQNYLIRNGVSIQGLLLHEHFLREAKKYTRSLNADADDKPEPTKAQEQAPEPEKLLEEILSEKEIESMSVEAIQALLKRHGSVVSPADQKAELVAQLQVLWRRKTANKEGHKEAEQVTTRTEVRAYEEVVHQVESKEVHLNNGDSTHIETCSVGHEARDEVDIRDGDQTIELQGPPKPQRVSKIETLEDITSPEIIRKMEIKQIKALLSKHSVSFADCQEKHEIIQKLESLWQDIQKNKNREIQAEDLCKICMCERIDCVLLECGHVATCTDCGHKIEECPICRNYVAKVVRLYKS